MTTEKKNIFPTTNAEGGFQTYAGGVALSHDG